MTGSVDNTFLDQSSGTASTQVAIRRCGRKSIGVDTNAGYHTTAQGPVAS